MTIGVIPISSRTPDDDPLHPSLVHSTIAMHRDTNARKTHSYHAVSSYASLAWCRRPSPTATTARNQSGSVTEFGPL